MLKPIALALIRAYQKFLSPRKGYSCAYRVHASGTGCSGFGYHAIEKHGLLLGMRLLRRRLDKCAWQAREHGAALVRQARHPVSAGLRSQAGDCDVGGCDGCDAPDCGKGCDFPDGKACGRSACNDLDCGPSMPADCCSSKSSGARSSKAAAREDARRQKAQSRRDTRTGATAKSSSKKDSFPDVDVFDGDAD